MVNDIIDTLLGVPTFTDPFMSDVYMLTKYIIGVVLVIMLVLQVLYFFYYIGKIFKNSV